MLYNGNLGNRYALDMINESLEIHVKTKGKKKEDNYMHVDSKQLQELSSMGVDTISCEAFVGDIGRPWKLLLF